MLSWDKQIIAQISLCALKHARHKVVIFMMQFPPAETVIRAITAAQLQSPRLSDGENLFSALLKLISLRIIRKKGGELSWLPHPNKSGKTKLDSDQLVRQDTTEPSRALKVSLIQLDTGGGNLIVCSCIKGKRRGKSFPFHILWY